MTNPYDPDPRVPDDYFTVMERRQGIARPEPVSRGLVVWVLGSALATLVGIVIAALLWTGTVRAYTLADGRAGSDAKGAPRDENGSYPIIRPGSPRQGWSPVSVPSSAKGSETAGSPAFALSLVSGTATWYCSTSSRCTRGYPASGMFAAAGSELRAWKGELVRVRSGSRSVVVRLIDVCGCPGARIIDLYRSAFSRLASPSRGVIRVTVQLERAIPLPPTSTR